MKFARLKVSYNFREFFEVFQDPFLKFSLRFCILIIIHAPITRKNVSQV